MLIYQQIKSTEDVLFNKAFTLYLTTFSANERRSKEKFIEILENENKFDLYALINDEEFAGFITVWTFEYFIYVEHFTIEMGLRGKNIGSNTIKILLKKASLPVILEVATPSNLQAVNRINFYERFGFYVVPRPYAQPPYNPNDKLHPMVIMSNDYYFADKHFKMVRDTLYREVYHYYTSLSDFQLPG
ncbi:MAG: GNAT family N-acetyltransferase [Prevotellaceae bacterium]|jgi:ribosomal protein S18 acetylase RimI-like enzyme|nr:GNAT family N-acetyltransferase [Prevotellaceae bacterium]